MTRKSVLALASFIAIVVSVVLLAPTVSEALRRPSMPFDPRDPRLFFGLIAAGVGAVSAFLNAIIKAPPPPPEKGWRPVAPWLDVNSHK